MTAHTTVDTPSNSRVAALHGVIASAPASRIDGDDPDNAEFERWGHGLAMLVADVYLNDDIDDLAAVRDLLADAADRTGDQIAGAQYRILASVTRWVHQRHAGSAAGCRLEAASVAARLLRRVSDEPGIDNRTLVNDLGVHESQVSRAGRQLFTWGLVTKQRHGRTNSWNLTAAGRDAVAALKDQDPDPPAPIANLPLDLLNQTTAAVHAALAGRFDGSSPRTPEWSFTGIPSETDIVRQKVTRHADTRTGDRLEVALSEVRWTARACSPAGGREQYVEDTAEIIGVVEDDQLVLRSGGIGERSC